MRDVIKEMNDKNSSLLLITNLDDIACNSFRKSQFIPSSTPFNVYFLKIIPGLLNLRGSDIPFNPVFFSWVVIKSNGQVHLFVDSSKISLAVRQHLNISADVEMRESRSSDSNNNIVVVLHPYHDIDRFLETEVCFLYLKKKTFWCQF